MNNVTEESAAPQDPNREVRDMVMGLKEKYRLLVYLYYYEGYNTEEISRMLNVSHSTVRTRLRAARKKLKIMLEEDNYETGRA